jgi:hypothetical protein
VGEVLPSGPRSRRTTAIKTGGDAEDLRARLTTETPAQGNLANLELAFDDTLQVRFGPEQPVVEGACRLQVAHCDGDMIDPDNLRHWQLAEGSIQPDDPANFSPCDPGRQPVALPICGRNA